MIRKAVYDKIRVDFDSEGVSFMKFVHLSDLHIGKRVNEYSMLEDQEYILKQITSIIAEEEYNRLRNDCGKIRKILISSINTTKSNLG